MGLATLAASVTAGAQAGLIGSVAPVGGVAVNRDLQPNPVAARALYVEPHNAVRVRQRSWHASRPDDAALLARIADQPQGLWLGEWRRDVRGTVAARVKASLRAGSTPVLVAYNIPHRDCGLHSSGGASDGRAYRAWIAQMARGIGGAPAIVILEPDALAGMGCLPRRLRTERTTLIREAVDILSALPQTVVYIDAGNPGWMPPARIAKRLRAAGVAGARGFSVNVSGFATTGRSLAFGRAVSARTGGARFVVDTSRNGLGPPPSGEWCNPPDRALGPTPTAVTGEPLADGLLWVKRPGESDGTCNDGPPAGTFWPEYALGLARRAPAA
ncbi:MAG TPA: glycoside hydrolase family 6 protein [Miltoncostaeaceae bacterium]|nr:glycoside hydrolase family 6 protein [Miltoncostaeaceae bacterium]